VLVDSAGVDAVFVAAGATAILASLYALLATRRVARGEAACSANDLDGRELVCEG